MKVLKKILISQPRPASERNPYSAIEADHNVQIDFQQMIHLEGLSAKEFRAQHIDPLQYTAVLFQSKIAIEHYFRLCEEMRITVPDSMHYYCSSEMVANYLQLYINYRKRKVFFGPNNKIEDVLPAMHRRPNEKYMIVLSEGHNDDVLNMFAAQGVEITPAIMYRTVASEWPQDKPFDYDMIALFTTTGVSAIRKNFPDWQQGDTVMAAMGANTAQAMLDAGYRVDIQAPNERHKSLVSAIDAYLKGEE